MSEITIHTGLQGDETTLHVEWYDHNIVRHSELVVIKIEPYDKPRTLTIIVNQAVVFQEVS